LGTFEAAHLQTIDHCRFSLMAFGAHSSPLAQSLFVQQSAGPSLPVRARHIDATEVGPKISVRKLTLPHTSSLPQSARRPHGFAQPRSVQ
jgi:hypothetical protein